MKHIYNFKSLLFIILFHLSTLQVSGLSISITKANFQNGDNKYMEVYIQVIGGSVTFIPFKDSTMQASVNFTLLIKKNGEIVNFDKFLLKSPKSNFAEDFIGIRRIKVDSGAYVLEINATDANDSKNTFKYNKLFNYNLDNNICISDIQLLASVKKSNNQSNPFVKNGYYLEPVLSYFVPEKVKALGIYFEVYNTERYADNLNVKYSINSGYKGELSKEIFKRNISIKPAQLTPILTNIDIKSLTSGNYHLSIELLENSKVLFSKFVNFQRSNPRITNNNNLLPDTNFKNSFAKKISKDSLFYSLRAMTPLMTASNSIAINDIVSNKKIDEGRYFLWYYWSENNSNTAEQSYREYMKYANIVDKKFRSQVGYGFETARGYIYLKYGMPSQIYTRESEPTAPPYEIWFYDQIQQDNQHNIKFIFYIPSLAHNDFELLHSNCTGEKYDPTWFYKLYSKRKDSNIRNMKQGQITEFYNSLKNSFDNNAVILWEELR